MSADVQSARELFLHAVGKLPPEQWDGYVAKACSGDAELAQQTRHLLQVHREAGSFLDRPIAALGIPGASTPEDATAPVFPRERPSTMIGPYKLVEVIGEGGMGTVWLAQQTEPVKRLVALKVIKAGMDTRQVVARFEAERQALALMDHPNIARVLDGGVAPDGRPYFVMELVEGVPITGFCDEGRLTPRQRLELFVSVCQAVQHAHQKGVIHRDLKPSNVLVARYDNQAVPKVIDFGVAKATGQPLSEQTLHTSFGAVVGTLEYMSPEQATFNQLDIDTRSDVYALGVLLYELLTGGPPFSRKDQEQVGLLETLRVIREQEPTRPSVKLSTAEGLPGLATSRGTEPKRLAAQVRGELDWIVMKALEKDRGRRYETASAFAADVLRYLHDEPVQAYPPSVSYRLRKLVWRNKGPVLAASLVVLALVGGIIGTTWSLIRAEQASWNALSAQLAEAERADGERRAREEAQTRLAQVEKGTEILASVFRDLNPIAAELAGVTPRDLLGRRLGEAARQLEGEAVGDPLVVAQLQHLLGISLRELGHPEQAEGLLVKAGRTRERLLGADDLDTVATRHHLAVLYRNQKKHALAETLFGEVVATRTARLGPDHLDTLATKHHLAVLYRCQRKYALAEALCKEVLASRTSRLGADHLDTLATKHHLAVLYLYQGKYAAAETLYKEVLAGRTARLGTDHPDTVASQNYLAGVYCWQGKHALAETLYKEVLAFRTARLGADHPDTLTSQYDLAGVYWSTKQLEQAIPLLEETLKRSKATEHPATLGMQADLGAIYCDAARFADAIPLLEQAHRKGRKAAHLAWVGGALLRAYVGAGKRAEAAALVTERVREARQQFAAGSPELTAALADAGKALLDAKAYADAEPLLLDGYKVLRQTEAQIPSPVKDGRLRDILGWLVQLYEAWGKPDEAAKWRKELEALKSPAVKSPSP